MCNYIKWLGNVSNNKVAIIQITHDEREIRHTIWSEV